MPSPPFRILLLILFSFFAGSMLQAEFPSYLIENVPIDRVIQNLERLVSANPGDINSRINLARVHAMAYASNTETAPVRKARAGDPPSDEPEFGILANQFANIR